jgi:hypothetical protein
MLRSLSDWIEYRKALRTAARLRKEGRIDQAIETLEKQAQILNGSADAGSPSKLRARAICLGRISELCYQKGDQPRARVLCEDALFLSLIGDDLSGVRVYATNLIMIKRDDIEAAKWAALAHAAETASRVDDIPPILSHVARAFLEEEKNAQYVTCCRLAQEVACVAMGDPAPLRSSLSGESLNANALTKFEGIEYARWSVAVQERPEGYREFWCSPGRWKYTGAAPYEIFLAESLSGYLQIDRDPDFWSASDAALRLQDLPARELGQRELAVMGARRSIDYNHPRPWAAKKQADQLSANWNAETDPHIHPFASGPNEKMRDLWSHYGMSSMPLAQSDKYQVMTGYYMSAGKRSALFHEPWHGGVGVYYSWRTMIDWVRWPRRQEAAPIASQADPGKLLLFVSHRWEEVSHPDPGGRQLLALKIGLALSLAAAFRIKPGAQTDSGLPEVFRRFLSTVMPEALEEPELKAWADRVRQEAGRSKTEEELWNRLRQLEQGQVAERLAAIQSQMLVWYDYASMNQVPRSQVEEQEFRAELERLNDIQAGAATVAIATDEEYLTRAWCFLEICGGLRKTIVELTPSWGMSMSLSSSVNRWAHISDQLIASLNCNGIESIEGANLSATEAGDLQIVAKLISRLPLFGLVESDGSDLVGGSIPMPLRSGRWIVATEIESPVATELTAPLLENYGATPNAQSLQQALQTAAGADGLTGACGVWIYTTQRLLSLSWAARVSELTERLSTHTSIPVVSSVACTWADSRSLGDDGTIWTRYAPSLVETLIIITQADLPPICRIYESVTLAHLAAGVTVITYSPETGDVKIERPAKPTVAPAGRVANAIVTPRVRRSTATHEYLLLAPDLTQEQVNAMTALRLDPTDAGLIELETRWDDLDSLSQRRSTVEAVCRTRASCWEGLSIECFTANAWKDPASAMEQLTVIERLVSLVGPMSDNVLERRAKLYKTLYGEMARESVTRLPLPDAP